MLRWALIVAITVVATERTARADCADPFADPADVLEFHVRLSSADWDALRNTDQVGQGCDAQFPYFQVEFRCGNEDWISIGARRKRGDQRGKDTNEKPPIKLDFNRFVVGQRWPAGLGNLGFRRLSLNNGQEDNPGGILSALLTEHYAWRLMNAEVPRSSRAAYARLNVHLDAAVEYHGLYILIEDIDRTAIRRRFGFDEGTLLKTTSGSCRDQIVFDDGLPNATTEAFDAWMALDPNDFAGSWFEETEVALDLDELLRAEALRDVLANGGDTVLGGNHSNFYSFDSLDANRVRRHYLPWDLDDVFRPFPQDVAATTPIENNCSAVGNQTRCDDEIRPRYLEIACQLTNGTLHQDKLLAELAELDALVRPIVAEEVALVWGNDDPFDANVDGTYASELARMQTWIPERIASVRAQVENLGGTCADGCESGASEGCGYFDCSGVRSCVDGRWTTCIVDPNDEVPGNLTDDDCDGDVDENDPDDPDDPDNPDNPDDPDGSGSGCGCQSAGSAPPALPVGAAAAILALIGFRRRRMGTR